MSALPRLSPKPILRRILSYTGFWIWTTILLSILITGSVSWLRYRQQQIVQLATTQLESVRLARIDLSKGFLYTTLAGDPGSPFSEDEGEALIDQGIVSLEQTLADLRPEGVETTEAFRKSADAFHDALADWTQATTSRPDKAASLRIAFRELEYQAGLIDTQTQQNLNHLSARLDSEFAGALGVSASMLAAICGIVFLAGRAREESEDALRQSESRYRELVQNANSVIIRWTSDGTILFFNEYAQTLFGYSSDEIVGKHVGLLTPDRESTGGDLTRLVKDIVAYPEQFATSINENICRDGRRVWMAWTNKPLFDENGQVREILAVGNDITKRRQAEDALRESEERYRRITQALTDYIVTVRVEGGQAVETTHSPACVAVTGYSMEDFAANPDLWLQMVDVEDRAIVLEQTQRLLDGQDALPIEHRITRKDGMKRWVRNTPVPHFDPKRKLLSYDGLIQDITERKQAEKALQESESRYRSLIDNQSEVIARSDTSGRLTLVNDAYCRAFGKSREELIGQIFNPTVFPDDLPIALAAMKAIQSPPYRVQSETRHPTPQGIRWFEWENSAVLDENGKVVELQGAGRDITKRKQAEEALRESEERYRVVSGLTSDIAYAACVEPDGTIVIEWVAGALVHITGYTFEELAALGGWSARVHPEDMSLAMRHMQAHLTGQPDVTEYRILTKDDKVRWLRDYGYPVWNEAHSRVVRIIGAAQDITDRREAESALRASEEYYRLLFTHNPVPMWVYDKDSLAFLAVNDFAVDHYGYSQEEFLNMTIRDIRPPEDIPYLNEVLKKHTGQLRKVGTVRHRRKDGSLIDVEITGHEIEFEGRPAMLVLAMDVTERKRVEEEIGLYRDHLEELVEQRTAELKAANEQLLVLTSDKDEFVSNVSHELRTPISSLKLRQRLLESHPDQLDKHLDVIKRETERLGRTIEDLLQLSRLDQRRVELHPVPLVLNDLVGQYVADRLPIASGEGLTLSFEREPDLPSVTADAGLIGEVLGILLTNAVSYTPSGGQVRLRTHMRQDADGRWVGLSVSDTGPGISQEEQARLFTRFFRGGAGRQSGVPGTGLGLALAKEIVTRHGGYIEVQSDGTPGNGTTFKVWLPLRDRADDQIASGG